MKKFLLGTVALVAFAAPLPLLPISPRVPTPRRLPMVAADL